MSQHTGNGQASSGDGSKHPGNLYPQPGGATAYSSVSSSGNQDGIDSGGDFASRITQPTLWVAAWLARHTGLSLLSHRLPRIPVWRPDNINIATTEWTHKLLSPLHHLLGYLQGKFERMPHSVEPPSDLLWFARSGRRYSHQVTLAQRGHSEDVPDVIQSETTSNEYPEYEWRVDDLSHASEDWTETDRQYRELPLVTSHKVGYSPSQNTISTPILMAKNLDQEISRQLGTVGQSRTEPALGFYQPTFADEHHDKHTYQEDTLRSSPQSSSLVHRVLSLNKRFAQHDLSSRSSSHPVSPSVLLASRYSDPDLLREESKDTSAAFGDLRVTESGAGVLSPAESKVVSEHIPMNRTAVANFGYEISRRRLEALPLTQIQLVAAQPLLNRTADIDSGIEISRRRLGALLFTDSRRTAKQASTKMPTISDSRNEDTVPENIEKGFISPQAARAELDTPSDGPSTVLSFAPRAVADSISRHIAVASDKFHYFAPIERIMAFSEYIEDNPRVSPVGKGLPLAPLFLRDSARQDFDSASDATLVHSQKIYPSDWRQQSLQRSSVLSEHDLSPIFESLIMPAGSVESKVIMDKLPLAVLASGVRHGGEATGYIARAPINRGGTEGTALAGAGTAEGTAVAQTGGTEAVDTDSLAQDVYQILKRRLAVEKERCAFGG